MHRRSSGLLQGEHPSWHCAELLAFEVAPGCDSAHAQRFPCGHWLSAHLEGGLLERDLFPDSTAGSAQYEVSALTAGSCIQLAGGELYLVEAEASQLSQPLAVCSTRAGGSSTAGSS